MINIPFGTLHEFKEHFEEYRLFVNTCNIYFRSIQMINKHHSYLNNEDFENYYLNITKDIELETPPIDSFIPDAQKFAEPDAVVKRIFIVNRDTPEYIRIKKRVTLDDIFNTIPPTHDVHILLKENPGKLDDVVDDVYIYWCVHKYLLMINNIRLRAISTMTPVIEYVVENITREQWVDYLSSKRINEEKCDKYLTDNIFAPDFDYTIDYYKKQHDGFDAFEVDDLIYRLCTNIIAKTDIYMIIAVYLILTFSKVDIDNGNYDSSPCAAYVRDVLSKL